MLKSHTSKHNPLFDYSAVESKRFGMRIFRGFLNSIDQKVIQEFLIKNSVDIAIFRVPSENHYEVSNLLEIGIPFITADTLVYYDCPLGTYTPKDLKNDLKFISVDRNNIGIMSYLIETIFTNYTNHYFSNPLLDKSDLLEGYKEWALGYVENHEDGKLSWLVKKGDSFIGFATCSFDDVEAEGVLYGVHPDSSGGGVYGDIIRFTQAYFKEKGCISMKVSTQIQNYAVQKVWNREGFRLEKAFNTIHINSLLNKKEN